VFWKYNEFQERSHRHNVGEFLGVNLERNRAKVGFVQKKQSFTCYGDHGQYFYGEIEKCRIFCHVLSALDIFGLRYFFFATKDLPLAKERQEYMDPPREVLV
jgi:hypothetical protein